MGRRPGYYALRITVVAGLYVGGWATVALIGDSWWTLTVAAFLAVVFGQVALLAHDVAHRQVFRRRRASEVSGRIAGAGIGMSYGWWQDKHTRHHANPNHEDLDPDLDPDLLVWSQDQARVATGLPRLIGRWQAFLFFPLLTLEGFNLHVSSVKALANRSLKHRALDGVLLFANFALCLTVLFWLLPLGMAIAFLAVHQCLFGVYLGSLFAPNHKGMPILKGEDRPDFLRRQVLTSRNVRGGRLTDIALGGLYHQIEHHLFPSIAQPQPAPGADHRPALLRRPGRGLRGDRADHLVPACSHQSPSGGSTAPEDPGFRVATEQEEEPGDVAFRRRGRRGGGLPGVPPSTGGGPNRPSPARARVFPGSVAPESAPGPREAPATAAHVRPELCVGPSAVHEPATPRPGPAPLPRSRPPACGRRVGPPCRLGCGHLWRPAAGRYAADRLGEPAQRLARHVGSDLRNDPVGDGDRTALPARDTRAPVGFTGHCRRSVSEPAVRPPASALPPGPLRIEAAFTASLGQPLPQTADQLRSALLNAAAEALGLATVTADLRVTDLHEGPETAVRSRASKGAMEPTPEAAAVRSSPPVAGTGPMWGPVDELADVAAAVPGVARLTAVLGSRPIKVVHQDDPPPQPPYPGPARCRARTPSTGSRSRRPGALAEAATSDTPGPVAATVLITETAP